VAHTPTSYTEEVIGFPTYSPKAMTHKNMEE